jgi:hypothetical protein
MEKNLTEESKKRDDVLKRMLSRPPEPKQKPEKKKPAKK